MTLTAKELERLGCKITGGPPLSFAIDLNGQWVASKFSEEENWRWHFDIGIGRLRPRFRIRADTQETT